MTDATRNLRGAAYVAYGVVAYSVFAAVNGYAMGFVGNLWAVFGLEGPAFRSMDVGPAASVGEALAVDAVLLAVFAVQHSVMARRGFKQWWTRVVPAPIERSTYVLASGACLALLFCQWRPIGSVLWDVSESAWAPLVVASFLAGWGIAAASTFMIDHLELFGIRQVLDAFLGRSPTPAPFSTPAFYKLVRHPLYFGFLVAFWATPVMTVGHAVFAATMTLYILIAVRFEERDLVAHFGDVYADYRRRVPMLLPFSRRDRSSRDGT